MPRLLASVLALLLLAFAAKPALAAAPVNIQDVHWCRPCADGMWLNHKDALVATIVSQDTQSLSLITMITISGPGIHRSFTFKEVTLYAHQEQTYTWPLQPKGNSYRVQIATYQAFGSALVLLDSQKLNVDTKTPWQSTFRNLAKLAILVGSCLLWLLVAMLWARRPARFVILFFCVAGAGIWLRTALVTNSIVGIAASGTFAISALALAVSVFLPRSIGLSQR